MPFDPHKYIVMPENEEPKPFVFDPMKYIQTEQKADPFARNMPKIEPAVPADTLVSGPRGYIEPEQKEPEPYYFASKAQAWTAGHKGKPFLEKVGRGIVGMPLQMAAFGEEIANSPPDAAVEFGKFLGKGMIDLATLVSAGKQLQEKGAMSPDIEAEWKRIQQELNDMPVEKAIQLSAWYPSLKSIGQFGKKVARSRIAPEPAIAEKSKAIPADVKPETIPTKPESAPQIQKSAGGLMDQVPTVMETGSGVVKASEVSKYFQAHLGIPVRVGHFKQKAGGIFKPKAEVIRTKVANDLATLSHEAAHAIDKKLNFTKYNIPSEFKSELGLLDYDPGKTRVNEGFAEYMRYWLTTEDAPFKAPNFDRWFNIEFAKKYPDTYQILQGGRDMIKDWREQGAINRVYSQIDFRGKRKKEPGEIITGVKDQFISKMFDDLWPLEKAETGMLGEKPMQAVESSKLRAAESPSLIARAVSRTASAKARMWVEDGAFDFSLNKIGPGLKQTITPVAKNWKEFITYGYAKRALSLWDRGINPGISKGDAMFTIGRMETPAFKTALEGITQWSHSLIDYLADAGGLSPEVALKIKTVNNIYLPLKRVFEDSEKGFGTGKPFVDMGTPVKRIKGSGREIVNPLESLIGMAAQIISTADRTRVARALVNMAERTEGAGKYVEKIPPPSNVTMLSRENLFKQIEKQIGEKIPEDFLAGQEDAMMTIYTNSQRYMGKDNIVSVVRDGKREFFEVEPNLYRCLKDLDSQQLQVGSNLLRWIITAPARAVRMGATGIQLGFGLANFFRDSFTRAIQTQAGRGMPHEILRGFAALMNKGETYSRYRRSGVEMSHMIGLDRKGIQKQVKAVLEDINTSKALNVVKHPIEAIREIISWTEAPSRIAEFEMQEAKMKTQGDLASSAVLANVKASDVTVNFRRMGAYVQILNQMIPYFNPAIQGMTKMMRSFKEQPLTTGLRAVSYITVPTVALWYLNKDEQWYKDLPEWQKAGFWNFKLNDNTILRLPRPFEYGYLFGSTIEGGLNAWYNKNPKEAINAVEETVGAILPVDVLHPRTAIGDIMPAFAKPLVEAAWNYNSFRQKPIVPAKWTLERYPQDQFFPWTPKMYQKASNILNNMGLEVSPLEIQHVANGYTGGLSEDIVGVVEGILKNFDVVKETEDIHPSGYPVIGRFFTRMPEEEKRVLAGRMDKAYEITKAANHSKILQSIYGPDSAQQWREAWLEEFHKRLEEEER